MTISLPESELRVIAEARRLVFKIQIEEWRGTPVHPAGHPDCPWTLEHGGYPSEYAALAHALDELDRARGGVRRL